MIVLKLFTVLTVLTRKMSPSHRQFHVYECLSVCSRVVFIRSLPLY